MEGTELWYRIMLLRDESARLHAVAHQHRSNELESKRLKKERKYVDCNIRDLESLHKETEHYKHYQEIGKKLQIAVNNRDHLKDKENEDKLDHDAVMRRSGNTNYCHGFIPSRKRRW